MMAGTVQSVPQGSLKVTYPKKRVKPMTAQRQSKALC